MKNDDIAARLRMYANASIDGGWASVFRADLNIAADEIERLRKERDEARRRTNSILTEIDCRIEHGAESNGHLEAIRSLFKEDTNE
jgi:F0F1-type ATP synthase epsilon subunit